MPSFTSQSDDFSLNCENSLLRAMAAGSLSCNFCLNYNKHQECKPELGICSAYIDKRYLK